MSVVTLALVMLTCGPITLQLRACAFSRGETG